MRATYFSLSLLLLGIAESCSAPGQPVQSAKLLQIDVETSRTPVYVSGDPAAKAAWQTTKSFYAERQFRPVWTTGGRTNVRYRQLLRLLNDRKHGLSPDLFDVSALSQETPPADVSELEVRATYTLVRYVTAIANGYAAPGRIEQNCRPIARNIDIKTAISEAIESNTLDQLADRLSPQHLEYAKLQEAAARYRSLVSSDESAAIPGNLKVKPGA